jgi:hypothetical protein
MIDLEGVAPTKDPLTSPFTTYEDASDAAEYHYGDPSGGHGGLGDAYRHCVASCWLTQNMGSAYARAWAWLNETITFGPNPPDDLAMDEYNNACGQDFGSDPDADCSLSCLSAAENGQLHTMNP